MTSTEYRAALESLGLSQVGAARFLGVHEVTGRRWAKDGPPEPVARFLRLMIALQFSPDYVERVLNPRSAPR